MRSFHIRFSPSELEALQTEAHHAGVSAAQFAREAVAARATFSYVRRQRGRPELDHPLGFLGVLRAREAQQMMRQAHEKEST